MNVLAISNSLEFEGFEGVYQTLLDRSERVASKGGTILVGFTDGSCEVYDLIASDMRFPKDPYRGIGPALMYKTKAQICETVQQFNRRKPDWLLAAERALT